MKEIWKDIRNYEGLYQVSNYGNIKTIGRYIDKKMFGGKISKYYRPEKLLKPGYLRGYQHVSLCKNSIVKQFKVHRLVAETFLINPNNYPIVNHKNEIKDDNRVENLEWCTNIYNTRYSLDKSKTSSKYIGVNYNKYNNKWKARYKGNHLGYYSTQEEAFKIVREKEINDNNER